MEIATGGWREGTRSMDKTSGEARAQKIKKIPNEIIDLAKKISRKNAESEKIFFKELPIIKHLKREKSYTRNCVVFKQNLGKSTLNL